jgi:8-oxo-dGTP diphosphatase
VRVKVRAVIVDGERLLVVPERRRGAHSHMALPGGRVNPREAVTDALKREVREETGLDVIPQRLLYVAEVTAPHQMHELNLIFLAEPISFAPTGQVNLEQLSFIELAQHEQPLTLPPVVAQISRDLANGWAETPRWLGNIWDRGLNNASS